MKIYSLVKISEMNTDKNETAVEKQLPKKILTYAIGRKLYESCYFLNSKTLEIPEGYTHIPENGLCACGMECLVIPQSICDIHRDALAQCRKLKKIVVAEDNPYYCVINEKLYRKETLEQVWAPANSRKTSLIDELLCVNQSLLKQIQQLKAELRNVGKFERRRQYLICNLERYACTVIIIDIKADGVKKVVASDEYVNYGTCYIENAKKYGEDDTFYQLIKETIQRANVPDEYWNIERIVLQGSSSSYPVIKNSILRALVEKTSIFVIEDDSNMLTDYSKLRNKFRQVYVPPRV